MTTTRRQLLASAAATVSASLVRAGEPSDRPAAAQATADSPGIKEVYCEKPLTLTIDEGKQIRKAVRDSGRIVQVGSWHRSDSRFRLAVELVRAGRIGRLEKVEPVLMRELAAMKFNGPLEIFMHPVPRGVPILDTVEAITTEVNRSRAHLESLT